MEMASANQASANLLSEDEGINDREIDNHQDIKKTGIWGSVFPIWSSLPLGNPGASRDQASENQLSGNQALTHRELGNPESN